MSEPIASNVELHLKPVGMDCRLFINGYDISNKAYKIEIVAEVDKPTSVVVYYHLLDVTALGDTWVQYIASPRKAAVVEVSE